MKEVKHMTDEEVAAVRGDFLRYKALQRDIERWKNQIEYLDNKMYKATTGSPKPLPEGSREYDPHWRTPLADERDNCTALRKAALIKQKLIKEFLLRLPAERDQNIFNDLYFNNIQLSEQEVADKYGYHRRGLQDRVKELIRIYWKY